MTHRILLAITAALLVTVSVAAYYRNGNTEGVDVLTAPVLRGSIVQSVEATGALQPVRTVQVGSQVSGTVAALHADFNTRVRQGQVIAELEPSLFEAQVEQAEASLRRLEADAERLQVAVEDARSRLRRAQELSHQQLLARMDLDTAETELRQAEASLKAADAQIVQAQASVNQSRINLGHTVIRAPIAGIVISRDVDVGQTVAASMSAPVLFHIARDLAEMQVNALVDESDIGRIQPGQPVAFRVDAYPDAAFSGTVSQVRLEPVNESGVVSYVTIIDAPNPDLRLKPGMTAMVTIEIARADDVLHVPNAALRVRPPGDLTVASGDHVWVPRDGVPEPRDVRTGLTDGVRTAVSGGELAEQTSVITAIRTSDAAARAPARSPLLPFGRR